MQHNGTLEENDTLIKERRNCPLIHREGNFEIRDLQKILPSKEKNAKHNLHLYILDSYKEVLLVAEIGKDCNTVDKAVNWLKYF